MEMNEYFSRLEALIAVWVKEIELHNSTGSTDKNKYSEFIAAKLLNAAFLLNLEVLPKNHPAVDLGDKNAGIAFQITSRTDLEKIKTNLQSFTAHNLVSQYPNGMRFLLLVNQKPRWQEGTKADFNSLLPGFDADRDIYVFPGIIDELKRNYLGHSKIFQELMEMMEWQFGNKGGAAPLGVVQQWLREGSRRHYEDLCGGTGRFRHLNISDIILQQPHKTWLDFSIKSFSGVKGATLQKSPLEKSNGTLLDIIPQLWQNECRHAVVKGDGGMGKTVSLVRLWDEFTKQHDATHPIPVFIQLNEINTVAEGERMNFILSAIWSNYLNSGVSEEEIMNFLKQGGEVPSVVLLLDGFNEVTVDNKELLIQVRKLMEQARGVQVVITSRYDMRGVYGWEHLHLLELAGLEETQVREYLEEKKIKMPGGGLAGLLRNPMMLTLYASTCEVQEKAIYQGDFKRQVETAGELLWNFMEAQAVVLLERLNYDQKKWWFYKFLLKFMLPALGYEMEKAGLFAFSRDALYRALDTYCLRFSRPDFFETFADYMKYEESLPIGACADDKMRRKRVSEIEDILCNVLFMVVKEWETYRFLHQDFRDYFAALHILHEAEMGVNRGELVEVLKDRALPVYIRRFMGEIEGEHYQRPVFQEGKGWLKRENGASLLNRVLDLCRGVFDGSVGFGSWNIIEVWKEVRGELSGADLSRLDLSRVVLNGSMCSRFFRSDYLAARFDGSLVYERCLFPRGHTGSINNAMYSEDDKKILSASDDGTIKEWDVASGQCLKTTKNISDDSMTEGDPGGVSQKLKIGRDRIQIISSKTGKTLRNFINIPGLFIQGCSFKNLHQDSDLSEESKKLPRQYGAIL